MEEDNTLITKIRFVNASKNTLTEIVKENAENAKSQVFGMRNKISVNAPVTLFGTKKMKSVNVFTLTVSTATEIVKIVLSQKYGIAKRRSVFALRTCLTIMITPATNARKVRDTTIIASATFALKASLIIIMDAAMSAQKTNLINGIKTVNVTNVQSLPLTTTKTRNAILALKTKSHTTMTDAAIDVLKVSTTIRLTKSALNAEEEKTTGKVIRSATNAKRLNSNITDAVMSALKKLLTSIMANATNALNSSSNTKEDVINVLKTNTILTENVLSANTVML
jgi:hypothetical protein